MPRSFDRQHDLTQPPPIPHPLRPPDHAEAVGCACTSLGTLAHAWAPVPLGPSTLGPQYLCAPSQLFHPRPCPQDALALPDHWQRGSARRCAGTPLSGNRATRQKRALARLIRGGGDKRSRPLSGRRHRFESSQTRWDERGVTIPATSCPFETLCRFPQSDLRGKRNSCCNAIAHW